MTSENQLYRCPVCNGRVVALGPYPTGFVCLVVLWEAAEWYAEGFTLDVDGSQF